MAEFRKILGQCEPANTTDTLLYTCPAGMQAIVSTIFVCNRNAAARTFRMRAAKANDQTAGNHQYLYYDTNVPLQDTLAITVGLTLGPGESIYVRRSAADVNFSCFGVEVSP